MTFTTDPRRFLYRDNQLDPQTAQRLASDLLTRCDDGELFAVSRFGKLRL